MLQPFDASKSLTTIEQESTVIAVIEMSQAKWLVAGVVPGVERQPLKRLAADDAALLKLLHRWRNEAAQAGRQIKRIVVAYEAGRDGFWLARWLQVRGVEAYVIHPTSIAVSREHRRAKTDRLDTELLMRAFLGWLRGEKRHCSMVTIPTVGRSGSSAFRLSAGTVWMSLAGSRFSSDSAPGPFQADKFFKECIEIADAATQENCNVARLRVDTRLHPKQLVALRSNATEILYGGANRRKQCYPALAGGT